jgi:hypothetical protein
MPTASVAVVPAEFPRAVPLGNESTMTAYQTLAQSLSAIPLAASDPTTPFSLPL